MSDGAVEEPIRVLVVDDHDLFRSGLRRLLEEAGMDVVGEARSGREAIRRAAQVRPRVVVMDVSMPEMSGIETTRRVLEVSPGSAVLMLTVSDDEDTIVDAVLAGASCYLLKGATLPEIIRAVRAAAAGEALIAPEVAGALLAQVRRHTPRREPREAPGLSGRELEVLRLLVAGCENGEIGRRMHLSASTIKHHVSSTIEKLGVENRIQAAVLAVRHGLVNEGSRPSG